MTLQEIYQQYSAPFGYGDKGSYHAYLPTYERFLSKESQNLIEIGIAYGHSLMMWSDWLPEANIYGIDIKLRDQAINMCWNRARIHMAEADATKLTPITKVLTQVPWDAIIDDGSHRVEDQLASFMLFYPSVREGGHYFIEDIQGQGALDLLTQHLDLSLVQYHLYDGRGEGRPSDELMLVIHK